MFRHKIAANAARFLSKSDHFETILIKRLRILTGKKHHQMKLQLLQKVWIWTLGSLVHYIDTLQEALKLKQNFQKNKAVAGKTPFFVIFSILYSSFYLSVQNYHWLSRKNMQISQTEGLFENP